MTGMAAGALALPPGTRLVPFWNGAITPIPSADKRQLADAALGAARSAGASYCDVRIGRYLNQFVITRETKVQNVVNTESSGVGVRVIANGAWGFAATSEVTPDSVARTARQAVAVAKANAKLQAEPVQLAPDEGRTARSAGRRRSRRTRWKCRSRTRSTCCSASTTPRLEAGANFVNSILFLVNEQKYFASTDGSYIDQDIHRIWAPMTVTAVDKATGKFRTRDGLSRADGHGLRIPRRRAGRQDAGSPGRRDRLRRLLRHDRRRGRRPAKHARRKS